MPPARLGAQEAGRLAVVFCLPMADEQLGSLPHVAAHCAHDRSVP
jgi:hypothetical protein